MCMLHLYLNSVETPMGIEGTGDEAEERHRSRREPRWRYTVPALLFLLLRDGPTHGYDLMSQLPRVFPGGDNLPDPGALYRTLRTLEADGAVTSSWEADKAGAPRRVYRLTDAGHEQLDAWIVVMTREAESMKRFLSSYHATQKDAQNRETASAHGET